MSTTLSDKRAIILGNGPSLKGFTFTNLDGLDVFGMNVAYRYWDRISWYPLYYSCLDLVVGKHHIVEIKRLIENANDYGIKLFLLRNNIMNELQQVRNVERIVNFDLLRENEHLLSADPITTGSHTAAWAAILGYKEIFLLGIDCNYQEIVSGAQNVSGNELVIVEEKPNPNYFIDDYQRKGDRYNIPNPNKELHIRSWRNIQNLMKGYEANILNANLSSKVDAFDFCRFEQVKKYQPIDIIPKEDVLINNECLNTDLMNSSCASLKREQHARINETNIIFNLFKEHNNKVMIDVGAHHGTALMPFLNKGWRIFAFEPDEMNYNVLVKQLFSHKNKDLITLDTRCVSNISQTGVSFYRSDQSTGISGLSAFHESHVKAQSVDTISLNEYFKKIDIFNVDFLKIDTEGYDLFVLQGFPWERFTPAVIECEFEDKKTIPLGYTFHDLAQYLVKKGYTTYVSEWHPIIRYGIPHDWNRLVRYPCVLNNIDGWGNLIAFRNPIDESELINVLNKVLKIGDGRRISYTNILSDENIKTNVEKKSDEYNTLAVNPRVFSGNNYEKITKAKWHYTNKDATQNTWIAIFNVFSSTKDRSYNGIIRLSTDQQVKCKIILASQDSTKHEGISKIITLYPNITKEVILNKMFNRSHKSIKLQVEIIEINGGRNVELTIDTVNIIESLTSIYNRLSEEEINLSVANKLFREGNYSTAMSIYIILYKMRRLDIYINNALMSAHKLGMRYLTTKECLLRLVN